VELLVVCRVGPIPTLYNTSVSSYLLGFAISVTRDYWPLASDLVVAVWCQ